MTPSNIIRFPQQPRSRVLERDENITDCSGEYHGHTIMHSRKEGFYLRSYIWEGLQNGNWEVINEEQRAEDMEEAGVDSWRDLEEAGTHRFTYGKKPITIDQAARLFMVGWQDDAGLADFIRAALDKAGVPPLEPLK
jgi:hypothetical protein